MSEINKIGPAGVEPHKALQAKPARLGEGDKFKDLLKTVEAFSAEVDRTVDEGPAASMDSKVSQINKTIDSLEGIVRQLEPGKPEHHGPTAKQAADKYGKMDKKS